MISDHLGCLRDLRGYIARADRAEIAGAQRAILECALAQPDHGASLTELDALRSALTTQAHAGGQSELQQAYETVVLAMIERTRTMIADRAGAA